MVKFGGVADAPARSRQREIIGAIQGLLRRDWKGIGCRVEAEEGSGLLVVYIDPKTVESLEGLHAYMNVLIKNNDVLAIYLLTRVAHRWNICVGEEMVFAIRPPWVRPDKTDSFYHLHPEHSSYQSLSESGFYPLKPMRATTKTTAASSKKHASKK